MFWPCDTRTSTCRNLATISSGLYRFLAITVLLDVKDISQVGPLQWGRIIRLARSSHTRARFSAAVAECRFLDKPISCEIAHISRTWLDYSWCRLADDWSAGCGAKMKALIAWALVVCATIILVAW